MTKKTILHHVQKAKNMPKIKDVIYNEFVASGSVRSFIFVTGVCDFDTSWRKRAETERTYSL